MLGAIRVLHGYTFLHPDPNRFSFSIPGPEPDPTTLYPTRIVVPGTHLVPGKYFPRHATRFKLLFHKKKNIMFKFLYGLLLWVMNHLIKIQLILIPFPLYQ